MFVIQSEDLTEQEIKEKIEELLTMDAPGVWTCNFCSKSGSRSHMREHVECCHVDGLQFPCGFCDKTFRSRNGIRLHASRQHKSKN